MAKQEKTRKWSVVTYLQMDEVLNAISIYQELAGVVHYAIIEHEPETEEKQRHIHIALYFQNARRRDSVCELFKGKGNAFAEPIKDSQVLVYKYFIHKGYPDKKQYSIDDIRSDNIEFWNKEVVENTALTIVEDLIRGRDIREMLKEYGRDFVINYQKYYEMASLIKGTREPKETAVNGLEIHN